MAKKKKIQLSANEEELNQNPFASMDLGTDLPPAPKPKTVASPTPPKTEAKQKGKVYLRRETAGRGGKTVTTLRFESNDGHKIQGHLLDPLLKPIKSKFGCGGTRENNTLIIQGDLRQELSQHIEKLGYRPILAGG